MRVKRRHSGRIAGGQRTASASRNRLPARIALRYVRVVARGIGAVVPVLRGAGFAGAVVAVVRIVIRSIWIVSPSEPITPPPTVTPVALAVVPVVAVTVAETIVEAREATMPSAAMKSAKSTVKRAGVKAAVMEATAAVKTAAMEATTAVKTAAPPCAPAWARSGWQSVVANSRTALQLVPESFLPWSELDVRLIRAWITPLNRRGTVTAGRGFAAYPLITEVLLLTGRGKLFPVKLGKQRGARRQ